MHSPAQELMFKELTMGHVARVQALGEGRMSETPTEQQ